MTKRNLIKIYLLLDFGIGVMWKNISKKYSNKKNLDFIKALQQKL